MGRALTAEDIYDEIIKLQARVKRLENASENKKETVSGVINADGTIAASPDPDGRFSVAHTASTGIYAITFNPVFAEEPSFNATPVTGGRGIRINSASGTTVTILLFATSTNTAGDNPFHFSAEGLL